MYYWFNMLQNIKYRKIYGYQLNFVMGYNVLTKEKTIMNLTNIFESTDFVHASGTKEELQVAEFLKGQCEELGVTAKIEAFRVAMGDIEESHLFADGKEIPCKAFNCCGSGVVEGELYYMPGTDPVSVVGAKDKIVLLDTQGIGFFGYQDLMKAGAKGIIFQYGNVHFPNTDIDQRDLREAVVGEERKVLCAMIHSSQAVELVNKDPDMDGKIQVVFVENYCVSVAEILIPAADISEQISTAGMEASGTGNMKFMMNGALTIGTMDGANIEIAERVGQENIFIFGDSAEGNYNKKMYHTYNPGIIFENHPGIRDVCNCLIEGNLLRYGNRKYSEIYQNLLFGEYGEADPYYILADFPSYIETYEKVYHLYVDHKDEWIKKAIVNTAKSGYFSSDRTIEQYNEKIWNLKPVK